MAQSQSFIHFSKANFIPKLSMVYQAAIHHWLQIQQFGDNNKLLVLIALVHFKTKVFVKSNHKCLKSRGDPVKE